MARFLETHRRQWDTDAPVNAPVQAPEKQGPAYTIDNRLGYRVEDTPRGKRRHTASPTARMAGRSTTTCSTRSTTTGPPSAGPPPNRPGRRRPTPDGLHAIEKIDEVLAKIGRKRTRGHEREMPPARMLGRRAPASRRSEGETLMPFVMLKR